MSVLQEANVLLLCQSTSRAGAEEEQGHREYGLTHMLAGQRVTEDTDTSPYLNGRGTVVWLLPCERPI